MAAGHDESQSPRPERRRWRSLVATVAVLRGQRRRRRALADAAGRAVPSGGAAATRVESLALAATVPAFYLAMQGRLPVVAASLYLLAFTASAWAAARQAVVARRRSGRGAALGSPLAWSLCAALLLSALLPQGDAADLVILRLGTAALTVLRWAEFHLARRWRGALPQLLGLGVGVLGLCGLGFWWLEPRAHSFGDGLWLAFTTAATVGYGDIVPSVPASKVFAVFVVLMGFAVLSVVTASIAALWVQTEERRIEHEMLRDLHRELRAIRSELAEMQEGRRREPSGMAWQARFDPAPTAANAALLDAAQPAGGGPAHTGLHDHPWRRTDMRVGDICNRSIATCVASTPASEVAELMRDQRVTEVVVVDERSPRRVPLGIVTFRDMVVRVIANRADPAATTAGDIMSSSIESVLGSVLTYDAVRKMRERGLGRLIVLDEGGSLVGVMTADAMTEFLAGELVEIARVSSMPVKVPAPAGPAAAVPDSRR